MQLEMLTKQNIAARVREWERLEAETRRVSALPPKSQRRNNRPAPTCTPVYNVTTTTVPTAATPPAPRTRLTDAEQRAALQNVHASERDDAAERLAELEWDCMTLAEKNRWTSKTTFAAARAAELTNRLKCYTDAG